MKDSRTFDSLNRPFNRFLFFSLLRNSRQEVPQVRKQCFYPDFQPFCSFIIRLVKKEAIFLPVGIFQCLVTPTSVKLLPLRGEKESWIRSKYVEKKFIQKLPETGKNVLLLRPSSAVRSRTVTQERTAQRPPLKPKPSRATLPRLTGSAAVRGGGVAVTWLLLH